MCTRIRRDGSISVEAPFLSQETKWFLKALMDVLLGVAACSVSESRCNGGKCSAIKIIVDDEHYEGLAMEEDHV